MRHILERTPLARLKPGDSRATLLCGLLWHGGAEVTPGHRLRSRVDPPERCCAAARPIAAWSLIGRKAGSRCSGCARALGQMPARRLYDRPFAVAFGRCRTLASRSEAQCPTAVHRPGLSHSTPELETTPGGTRAPVGLAKIAIPISADGAYDASGKIRIARLGERRQKGVPPAGAE